MSKLIFERVTGTDLQIVILYDLLSRRRHTISHLTMPGFDEHRDFIRSNPYLSWYIIQMGDKYIGSIYLKNDNSIGLNLEICTETVVRQCILFIMNNFHKVPPVQSIVPDYFYVNVPSSNFELIEVMERSLGQPIQVSFKVQEPVK